MNDHIAPPNTPLVYNGAIIHQRNEMLSLTDMWKAAGKPSGRGPAEWLRSADAVRFINAYEEILSVGNSHSDNNVIAGKTGSQVVLTQNGGRSPGTWAHWQVGLAYAKYLSPEFHMWCNQVVRDRMEGRLPSTGDHEGLVTGVDPAVMKALGGMIKGIMAKQLNETVPALVEHAMIEGGHVVSTDFKPALEVLKECKVPARKRRSFSQKVSGRLRRFSTLWQFPLRLSRETNRYLFHIEAIKKWMTSEGDQMIRDHVAAISGQALLHLVPPPKPNNAKPPGGKPSRRAAMTGLAVMAASALALASVPPAKALPSSIHDGLAVLQIDGRPVTIDTNRYKPEAGTKFAIVHFDGRMTLEPVEFTDGAPWYGKRSAATEWEPAGTGDLRGATAIRKRVWVLGAVVA